MRVNGGNRPVIGRFPSQRAIDEDLSYLLYLFEQNVEQRLEWSLIHHDAYVTSLYSRNDQGAFIIYIGLKWNIMKYHLSMTYHLNNHIGISHRTRSWDCHTLCKMLKWLDDKSWCYGWKSFREIWVHFSDVIISAMASQIPASWWFAQPFRQTQIKENTKAPRHWPLWGEFTGDRWIPLTQGQ